MYNPTPRCPPQRLVVSNCCVKAKGITSIASECSNLTHLVFAVYKVNEPADLRELQNALRQMVRSLHHLQVLKIRVLAGCITEVGLASGDRLVRQQVCSAVRPRPCLLLPYNRTSPSTCTATCG